jgi:hypothetical protein
MESTHISTAALRDDAFRARAVAPFALSGAPLGVAVRTAGVRAAVPQMNYAVNVPSTTVDPEQDRPPRGVPR